MAYNITLEELLNQLNKDHSPNPYQQRYRQYQQRQEQLAQQRQAAAAIAAERRRRHAAAVALQRQREEEAASRAYAASFAQHPLFQNGFFYPYQDEEEDEEDEDYGYYQPQRLQRQQHPFFQPVNCPAYTPVAPIVRRKYPKQDQSDLKESFDLTDLLNYLAGSPVPESSKTQEEKAKEDEKEEDKPASEVDNISTPEVQPDTESAEVPQASIDAEAKEMSKKAAVEKENIPEFIPYLKRHTALSRSDSDPEPKIEISSRNFKNESLPYSPQTNVYDLANEYVAVLAIPGANLKDLHIDFHAATNEVVVKGVIPSPFFTGTGCADEVDLNQIKNLEIRSGAIERRIKFPNLPKIRDDDIKANYLNGLLTVKIPKLKDDANLVKAKKKVTIEDVPDEELVFESNPENFVKSSS